MLQNSCGYPGNRIFAGILQHLFLKEKVDKGRKVY